MIQTPSVAPLTENATLLFPKIPLAMPGALFFDGWEGASATIFDCDGTYLANLTLEGLDSETIMSD